MLMAKRTESARRPVRSIRDKSRPLSWTSKLILKLHDFSRVDCTLLPWSLEAFADTMHGGGGGLRNVRTCGCNPGRVQNDFSFAAHMNRQGLSTDRTIFCCCVDLHV